MGREIEKGSWEDLSVHGFRRFDRLYIQPYLPAWFMGVALAVLWYSWPG